MMVRDDAIYEFGPVRIDPRKRTIERNGQTLPCPSRAFDVLLLLLQRRGELVPKEELLAAIWPDTHVEESSLPMMISVIRRAIGDDGRKQKYIQTVSKCGYRFIAEVNEICIVEPGAPAVPPPAVGDPALSSAYTVPPLPARPLPTQPSDPQRYARVSVVTGCVAASFVILLSIYWLRSGTIAGAAHLASLENHRPSSTAEMWVQKGRYAWNLQTKAGFLQSIEYYQKAIAADAGDAAAYAGLAESYVTLPSYSERNNDEERSRAQAAAAKALALDGNLADPHIASGMVSLINDRGFARAEREFQRAIDLNPRSPLAQGELAFCLVAIGRTDEAVSHARQAKALDPLSIRAATDLGIVLYYGHRFMEAETEFEEALKLDPYSYRAQLNLGRTYLAVGKFDDARRVLDEASLLSNHDPIADGLMAEAKALEGDIPGGRVMLAVLERRAQTTYVAPMIFAYAFAGLGELDRALVYLKKARADRAITSLYLNVDPNWEALHGNPDFKDLVKDITRTTPE